LAHDHIRRSDFRLLARKCPDALKIESYQSFCPISVALKEKLSYDTIQLFLASCPSHLSTLTGISSTNRNICINNNNNNIDNFAFAEGKNHHSVFLKAIATGASRNSNLCEIEIGSLLLPSFQYLIDFLLSSIAPPKLKLTLAFDYVDGHDPQISYYLMLNKAGRAQLRNP